MDEYTPPPWPRWLFAADGRRQVFASQDEADATGEPWYRTPAEAAQALHQTQEAAAPEDPPRRRR